MTALRIPLLLAGLAWLTTPLAAQRFDSTIYGRGIDGTVGLLDGNLSRSTIAGGAFGPAVPATQFAATRTGSTWSPALPIGAPPALRPDTWAITAGGIVSGDAFGVVRQWNIPAGTATQLGTAVGTLIRAIGEHNGNLVVGGSFTPLGGIASLLALDASTGLWRPYGTVGTTNVTGTVFGALPFRGDLLVYGPSFQAPGIGTTRLARFDGTTWTAIPGTPAQPLEFAAVLANGDIVTLHRTPGLGTIPPYDMFRLSNGTWKQIAHQIDATVHALLELPNGDLLIGGEFTTVHHTAANGLARFDGTNWRAVANVQGWVFALRRFQDDVIAVGGNFTSINGIATTGIAGFTPEIPGTATDVGAGCVGLGGLNQLSPINQPLLGTVFTSRATGLGNPAFLVLARSSALLPSPIPLSTIFATGLPNCFVHGTSELLDMVVAPGSGSTSVSFAIPADPLFLGFQLIQQATYFEATEVTSTNAQRITIGQF